MPGAGATIEVFRTPSWYRDRLRSYDVEVDGNRAASNTLLIPLCLTVRRDRYVVLEQVNAP